MRGSTMSKIEGSLINVDGNAFEILAYFRKQAKKQGWSNKNIQTVIDEAKSADYAHLVTTIDSYLND